MNSTTNTTAPLDFRIWQLQDYDLPHIRRMIGLAAEQGINRVQLSHRIVMTAQQMTDEPDRARDVNAICDWAREKGVKIDVWIHELSGVPEELIKDGRAELDSPLLWKHLQAKYEKLFDVCPGVDGLVLSMHETAMSIYHDTSVESSTPPQARVARLIDELAGVCQSRGKELFVRTFSYEPDELKQIVDGIKLSKSDIVVMTKCVPHDWQPYYPYNPAIGNVGGKRQIIEFDPGNEFTGLSTIPYINIDYYKRHLDYDLSKGAIGAVLRVERFDWHAVDTPNEAVIYTFTRMLSDPSADPHPIYRQWLQRRYGDSAADLLYTAFMRTAEIVEKGYFVLGFWVTNHSLLPTFEYATKSLYGRTTAKWDPSTKPIETELFHPTRDTIRKIDEQKEKALELVNASLADLSQAQPYLKPDDYAHLKELFEREKAMVIVWKAAMDVIFGVLVMQSSPSPENRAYLASAADALESAAERNRIHLVRMSANWRGESKEQNVAAARGLVKLARKLAAQS